MTLLRAAKAVALIPWLFVSSFINAPSRAQLVKPASVSATTSAREPLTEGVEFPFQLEFSPAPDGFRGGKVTTKFRWEGPGDSGPARLDGAQEALREFEFDDQLDDKRSLYTMKMPILHTFTPGNWKLIEVSLSNEGKTVVPIATAVSFEILGPSPVQAMISAPPVIEAGQTYNISVEFADVPKLLERDCEFYVTANLLRLDTNTIGINLRPFIPTKDKLSGEMSHTFAPDYGSAKFSVRITGAAENAHVEHGSCWSPQLKGNLFFPLEITPSKTIVVPTSVSVKVNPSQADLLREEANRLNAKAQGLKPLTASSNGTYSAEILKSLNEARENLDQTEKLFKSRATEPMDVKVVDVFFDDIRERYRETEEKFPKSHMSGEQGEAGLVEASLREWRAAPTSSGGAESVIDSILHNVKAFLVAADSGSVAFDLVVHSFPPGATISFGRLGDKTFEQWHEKTNSTITNLPYAIWYIKFDAPECESVTQPFDPFLSHEHLVEAALCPANKH